MKLNSHFYPDLNPSLNPNKNPNLNPNRNPNFTAQTARSLRREGDYARKASPRPENELRPSVCGESGRSDRGYCGRSPAAIDPQSQRTPTLPRPDPIAAADTSTQSPHCTRRGSVSRQSNMSIQFSDGACRRRYRSPSCHRAGCRTRPTRPR